jgi:hypothetical protein
MSTFFQSLPTLPPEEPEMMKTTFVIGLRGFLAAISFLAVSGTVVHAWQPVKGPLSTQWDSEVTPDNALPEYPRPQMVRDAWQNLNGLWDYAVTAKNDEQPPARFNGQILVPYCIESALSGVMKPFLPDQKLWYRRTITIPEAWIGQRLLLHFGAVDWQADVFLNGREVGSHRGGYDGFTIELTKAVQKAGPQELVVAVLDPTDTSWHLHGKQTLHPGGCSYTASSGIWQTVWMEPVPLTTSIETIHAVPDLENGQLRITVTGRVGNDPLAITASASADGKQVSSVSGQAGFELSPALRENKVNFYKNTGSWFTTDLVLPMKDARTWSPGNPFLYDLTLTLSKNGSVLDTVKSYFGMRSLGKKLDPKGFTRFLLNGNPTMMAGALDQGFWPDGIYTAPTDSALKHDVEIAKMTGLNIIRKHVKVEPDRFYYWCDKLGLMVLQDMPTGGDGDAFTDLPTSPEADAQCELEKRMLIEQRWNHPSIIAWCLFNEGWGQHDTLRYAMWIKQLDPSRLVDEASGFPWHGGGDIQDSHGGTSPPNPNEIGIVSENGGFGVATPGHDWPCEIWTYHSYDPATDGTVDALGTGLKGTRLPVLTDRSKAWFTRQVAQMYTDLWKQKDTNGMTGQFFCQLYDTESECDGLVSYDRAVWKVDPDVIRQAARGELVTTAQVSNPIDFQYDQGQTASRRELRDPCIIHEGDSYYLVFTMWPFSNREEQHVHLPNEGGSPGIAIYSSKDLAHWTFVNWLVKSSDLADNCPYKDRFWAAELHRIDGKFYVIFTADNWIDGKYNKPGTWGSAGYSFIGVADNVTGPYRHITYVEGGTCDMTLFRDGDGQIYAIKPKGDVFLQKIDLSHIEQDEVHFVGPERRVVACSNDDIGLKTSPAYLEGPWLERINGRYCLFYAALYKDRNFPELLGYRTGVAYAQGMAGPWQKDPRGAIFFGGHLAIFDGPDGRKWFSYRGEEDNRAHGMLCIDPIDIDAAGGIQAHATLGPRMTPQP